MLGPVVALQPQFFLVLEPVITLLLDLTWIYSSHY